MSSADLVAFVRWAGRRGIVLADTNDTELKRLADEWWEMQHGDEHG